MTDERITLQEAIETGRHGMIQTGGEDNYDIDILREELTENGNAGGTDLDQDGFFFTYEEWAAYEKEVEDDAAVCAEEIEFERQADRQ